MNFMKLVFEKHKTGRRKIQVSEESGKVVSFVLYCFLYLGEMSIYLFKLNYNLE